MFPMAQLQQRPRTAIVTGAASGLGRALCTRLARDGWDIALCDINAAGAEETLRLVAAAGGMCFYEPLDITRVGQWELLRERLAARWRQLDLLVNWIIGGECSKSICSAASKVAIR
jgi:NAD(P)-dependent dehydrogenase (short-subunit alcohol dehydrogenase family)